MRRATKIVQTLCLAALLAVGLGRAGVAQELVNPQDVPNADLLARYRYALFADDLVIASHNTLARALMHQNASVDATGQLVPPFLETWFTSHESVDGLYQADFASSQMTDNYNTATQWGIYHRLCNAGGPNPLGNWYLLTYMDPPDGFKFGWDAAEVRANAAKYFAMRHLQFDGTRDGVGLLDTTGSTVTFTGWNQPTITVPSCLYENPDPLAWTHNLGIGQLIAMVSHVTPGYIVRHRKITQSYQACPPASDPSLTIGLAFMQNETDTFSLPNGTPILDANGNRLSATLAPKYEAGCAVPRTEFHALLKACVVGGWTDGFGQHFTIPGFEHWHQQYIQTPVQGIDPVPANINKMWTWTPDTSVPPTLVSSQCGTPSATPFASSNAGQVQQSQTLACSTGYPSYPNGTYLQVRTATTTTETLPAGSKPPSITSTTYSPWQTASVGCSNSQAVQQSQTLSCPSGFTGAIDQVQTGTQTNYATGGSSVAWSGNWQTTSDTCSQTVTQTLSCPSGYSGSVIQQQVNTPSSTGPWVTTSNTCQPAYCVSLQDIGGNNNDRYIVTMSDGTSYITINPPPCGSASTGGSSAGGGGGGNGPSYSGSSSAPSVNGYGNYGTYGAANSSYGGTNSYGGGLGTTGTNGGGGGYTGLSGAASGSSGGGQSGSNGGGSSGGSGSFIGSALARRREEDLDESEMLAALRRWRNGWVRRQPGGWALVQEYYRLGWTLILTIPPRHSDWDWIGEQVDAIHAAIRADDNWEALDRYVAMVRHLQAKWLNQGACV